MDHPVYKQTRVLNCFKNKLLYTFRTLEFNFSKIVVFFLRRLLFFKGKRPSKRTEPLINNQMVIGKCELWNGEEKFREQNL